MFKERIDMFYVNKYIKETVRVFPEQGRYAKYRFDMNENPDGLPKNFVDSVLKEITPKFLTVYPEPDRFLHKYADFIGVDFNNVTATNGSDTGLRYIMETFGEVGKDIVTVSPSFEMYWVNCCILGYRHVPVPYEDDMTIKIENILNVITDNTRIVALLNPNNPIGNVYTQEEINQVIEKTKQVGAILIIDEAYHYFYPNTFLKTALKNDNVIVLRTFSKAMSIPALRLGVIISNPQIIHYINNAKLTFDVNAVALLFGEKLLDNPQILKDIVNSENEGKRYTLKELKKKGYICRDCLGNYIFVKPNHNAKDVAKKLDEEKNVLVHPYSNDLLKDYIRVSVGSVESMKIFLKAFFDVDSVN